MEMTALIPKLEADMEKVTLNLLVNRVISDPAFRLRFMADPEVAISEANWDLPAQDLAALKEWHARMAHVTKLDELQESLAAFVATRTPRAA
jgi:hypothetical protein